MTRRTLTVVRPEAEVLAPVVPADDAASSPLLHLRISGRHGVFLLEQGEAGRQAVVDTRAAGGIACTCCGGVPARGECEHVALLRACGFLPRAA